MLESPPFINQLREQKNNVTNRKGMNWKECINRTIYFYPSVIQLFSFLVNQKEATDMKYVILIYLFFFKRFSLGLSMKLEDDLEWSHPGNNLPITVSGIGGNFFLFVAMYMCLLQEERKIPVDLILIHLPFANTMTFCTKGILDIMSAFHFSNSPCGGGCIAVVYLVRVACGLSVCTISLPAWFKSSPVILGLLYGESSNHWLHANSSLSPPLLDP